MPASRKLKVYRTPIGFHDAYVAAPSQKAALEAWGSDANLFARGVAELVEDPKLTKEPLAGPGRVIKRLRGSTAEQIAALPRDLPRSMNPSATKERPALTPRQPKMPKPSRKSLDAAEKAVHEAEARYAAASRNIESRQVQLTRERRQLERERDTQMARLDARRREAAAIYQDRLRRWER